MDSKFNLLKLILDNPKVYLSDYFAGLRTEIDITFVKLSGQSTKLDEANTNLWKEMIKRIESFEDETLKNFNSNSLNKYNLEQLDDDQTITNQIDEIRKILFLNKTITVFKIKSKNSIKCETHPRYYYEYEEYDEPSESDSESEQDYNNAQVSTQKKDEKEITENIYLLIINDEYLNEDKIKELFNENKNLKSEELTRELIAFESLSTKLSDKENRIIEISLELSKLKNFIFKSNELHTINGKALKNLQNLNLLDLSKNNLSIIDDYIFQELINLKNLWLNDNKISQIGKYAFVGLTNLEWLDLCRNEIKTIDETTFKDLVSLEILDLEDNQIGLFKPNVLQTNISLKNLFMKNNPFINRLVFNYAVNPQKINNPSVAVIAKKSEDKDYSSLIGRNLLKNSDAENGFENWTPLDHNLTIDNDTSSRDIINLIKKNKSKSSNILDESFGFVIETEQNGVNETRFLKKSDEILYKNFVTSYYLGSKYQVIDLSLENIDELFFENFKPNIEIGEYYVARNDCGSIYYMNVYLLNDFFEIIDKYLIERQIDQWADSNWLLESHTFEYKESMNSLRFILFGHGGKDTQYWAGNFGSKMTNGYVKFVRNTIN